MENERRMIRKYFKLFVGCLVLIVLLVLQPISDYIYQWTGFKAAFLVFQKANLIILNLSWLAIQFIRIAKIKLLQHFDLNEEDNLESRKLHTQITIIEKALIYLIILTSLGLILLSFDSIREIGIGIFASAGLAGIIIGLSAQKIVGAFLAGFQIAITQPFRIDDAVVVENEWGWIEEINLTYVVVRLWDKRRLVLPTTYFLEKPFQNWTRTNADIVGTVFLYTDYFIDFDVLRAEFLRLLTNCDLWDGKVQVLQVTDSKNNQVEIRLLMSAKNSPTAWDLRVHIREKMIEYIRLNYPESLPKTRVNLEKSDF